MNAPKEALETILWHIEIGRAPSEELRAAFDDLKDWCDGLSAKRETDKTMTKKTIAITLPLADVAALVKLGWEMANHISEHDQSATGSIYGVEHAHKTIAKVAIRLPISR